MVQDDNRKARQFFQEFFGWVRSRGIERTDSRLCGGVSGAIANRFGMQRGMVRFLFVLAAIFFVGLPIYAILWAVLPDEIDGSIPFEDITNKRMNIEIVPIVLMFLFGTLGTSIVNVFGVLVSIILAALIAFFVFTRMVGARDFENYVRRYDYDRHTEFRDGTQSEPETLFEQGVAQGNNANSADNADSDANNSAEGVDNFIDSKINSAFDKVNDKVNGVSDKIDDKLNRAEQKVDEKIDKYKNMYSKDYYREKYAKGKYRGATRGLAAVFVGIAFLLYGLCIIAKRAILINPLAKFDFNVFGRTFTIAVDETFPLLTFISCFLLLALGVVLIIEGIRRKAAPFLTFLAVVAIVATSMMTINLYRGGSSMDGECVMVRDGCCYQSNSIGYFRDWHDFGFGIMRQTLDQSGVCIEPAWTEGE
ncbi:MAG: PspC domain-containing protein [Bifidobacteriaceae bacterium]|jgi:phage shock protein PspC (stress-responsive transcriptional regulator)|nr:PspC domain-containing protein [Bifidobacteriaceae bacterium]